VLEALSGWAPPPTVFIGAMSFAAFLAVFFYFIHDWASLISNFIQLIIYRRKPMTLDEKLPQVSMLLMLMLRLSLLLET
jgi:hypothetical protein